MWRSQNSPIAGEGPRGRGKHLANSALKYCLHLELQEQRI